MTEPTHRITVTLDGEPSDEYDPEYDVQVTHPDECVDTRVCCCKATPPREECEGCKNAGCNECVHTNPWRCGIDYYLDEFTSEHEEFRTPGVYDVEYWSSGPDYWGEYDEGLNITRVEVQVAA